MATGQTQAVGGTQWLRAALRVGLVLALLGALPGPAGVADAGGVSDPPNILVFVTDDQREGLDVMPKTRAWLADGGTEYTQAHVTTPMCCPSRASIFTGRYVHNNNVFDNGAAASLDQQTTLQYYLRSSGYQTGIFGKYLNSWPVETNPPHFDMWATFSKNTRESYKGGQWNVQGTMTTVNEYVTTYLGNKAEEFFASSTGAPWLLFLSPPNPHAPFVIESKYSKTPVPEWSGNPAVYESDKSDKPTYIQNSTSDFAKGSDTRTKQLRLLMSVDDLVDRVMNALAANGQLDNTLVFFISDNGYLWSEHGWIGKNVPYTQSIRVPMLARWPGHIVAGGVDSRLVANIDIVPTALEAAGVAVPSGSPAIDGRSLVGGYVRDRLLIEQWRFISVPRWASLLTPTGQYVEYYDNQGKSVTFTEYYDLVADPWQLDNLSVPPEGMSAQLAADRVCVGEACP